MEQQPPPLPPQEISAMQAEQYARLGQPQSVKIFGILHVVFAALGLLGAAWTVFVMAAENPFQNFGAQTPELAEQIKVQEAMEQSMMPMTIISTILTVIVGLIMLKAGLLLLKKRRSGLLWSNCYAWTSLAMKVVNSVLIFAYVMPAMKDVGGGTPADIEWIKWIMLGSMIIALITPAIYPVLALVLLNRPKTKEWFAKQPT